MGALGIKTACPRSSWDSRQPVPSPTRLDLTTALDKSSHFHANRLHTGCRLTFAECKPGPVACGLATPQGLCLPLWHRPPPAQQGRPCSSLLTSVRTGWLPWTSHVPFPKSGVPPPFSGHPPSREPRQTPPCQSSSHRTLNLSFCSS